MAVKLMGGLDAASLRMPTAIYSDGVRLYVATYRAGLRIWNTIPKTNGVPADVVIGPSDVLHHPPIEPGPLTAQGCAGVDVPGARLP